MEIQNHQATELNLEQSFEFITRDSTYHPEGTKTAGGRGEVGTDTLRGWLKAGGILLTRSKRAIVNQIWKLKPALVSQLCCPYQNSIEHQIKADIKRSNQCVNGGMLNELQL